MSLGLEMNPRTVVQSDESSGGLAGTELSEVHRQGQTTLLAVPALTEPLPVQGHGTLLDPGSGPHLEFSLPLLG